MEYRLLLIYDRRENDPINFVAQTLVNAEAEDILPILNTSSEFTIHTSGEHELEWVIDRILSELSEVAYVKIYRITKSWGPGKRYNPSAPEGADGFIGKALDEYLLGARVNPRSFRGEYKIT